MQADSRIQIEKALKRGIEEVISISDKKDAFTKLLKDSKNENSLDVAKQV